MAKLIKESIFDYLNYDHDTEANAMFAVPNEIFKDLMTKYKFGKCAFAYSYYYLNMYLHLYAKYGTEDTVDKFTEESLRQMLGIAPQSQAFNEITKKGGYLDQLGYTSTVTDHPVALLRMERNGGEMEVHHYMYSEEKRDLFGRFEHGTNFTVKRPDKMYWRTPEDKKDDYLSGTMNECENTHIIPLQMFLHALDNPEIMIKGFYVYGFIIYKHDKNRRRGWYIPHDLFSKDININVKTLRKILKVLEKYNFITVIRRKNPNGLDLPNIYFPNLDPNKVVRFS